MLFWCSGCYSGGLGHQVLKKVQQLLTYCLHIGGMGAPYWSLRGSHWSLRDCFCLQLWIQGLPKEAQGVVMGPTENCNIPFVFFRFWELGGSQLASYGLIWLPSGFPWGSVGLCFSVRGLPLWHIDFLCFLDGFRDLPKSRAPDELRVIYVISGP